MKIFYRGGEQHKMEIQAKLETKQKEHKQIVDKVEELKAAIQRLTVRGVQLEGQIELLLETQKEQEEKAKEPAKEPIALGVAPADAKMPTPEEAEKAVNNEATPTA